MDKHKIYCFSNGGEPGFLTAVAIADDGYVLAQHICSSEFFMKHDLGITSGWKHDSYNAHFGAGRWELEWVDQPDAHTGIQAAFALNGQMKQRLAEEDTQ
jgi:hypothetical protein